MNATSLNKALSGAMKGAALGGVAKAAKAPKAGKVMKAGAMTGAAKALAKRCK